MLRGWVALCSPTQCIQQLLMEVWELQHCTALDPENDRAADTDQLTCKKPPQKPSKQKCICVKCLT